MSEMNPDPPHILNNDAESAASTASLVLLTIYIVVYLVASLWLFVEGWLNQFSALNVLWGYPPEQTFPPMLQSAMFSLTGAIMGCGVLGISSFYRYVSVENSFQRHHLWGYYFAPILAAVIGLVIFALLQSGLLVFSGSSTGISPVSHLGYLSIGFISGYGWYQFTVKIDELVGKLLSKKSRPVKKEVEADLAIAEEVEQIEDSEIGEDNQLSQK